MYKFSNNFTMHFQQNLLNSLLKFPSKILRVWGFSENDKIIARRQDHNNH